MIRCEGLLWSPVIDGIALTSLKCLVINIICHHKKNSPFLYFSSKKNGQENLNEIVIWDWWNCCFNVKMDLRPSYTFIVTSLCKGNIWYFYDSINKKLFLPYFRTKKSSFLSCYYEETKKSPIHCMFRLFIENICCTDFAKHHRIHRL